MMTVPFLGLRGDGLDTARYVLFLVSVIASVMYLSRTGGAWYPAMPWLKAVPVGALALLALISNPNHSPLGYLLVAALVLSTAGDVFLALKDEQRWFVFGLGSFLLGHVAFIAIFGMILSQFGMAQGLPRQAGVVLVLVAGIALFLWLRPKLGEMTGPVAAYVTVIMVMVACALLVPASTSLIIIGALLFMISDAMIAVSRFNAPFEGVHHLIWVSYYLAQYFLTAGILRG